MLGKIISIDNNIIKVKLSIDPTKTANIINLYVIMQDGSKSYIGEILNINNDEAIISLLGEYKNNHLSYGFVTKPSFSSQVSLINSNYITKIISDTTDDNNSLIIGKNPYYPDTCCYANINSLFGNHFALFGNSGSGKSCGFARIVQNLMNKENITSNANIIIFDAFGEYKNAFEAFNQKDNIGFKAYSTNEKSNSYLISIPPWFLDVDDYALLLNVTDKNQLPVLEKALRNVDLFVRPEEEVIKYKNSILASSLLDILISGSKASQIRDQFTGVLTKFNTKELNLETTVYQPGYTRSLRQCLLIDENGKINALELVTNFLEGFIVTDLDLKFPDGSYKYTLKDFANALEFALIDEGIWKSQRVFDQGNILKVRLNALIESENAKLFEREEYINKESYIKELFTLQTGKKSPIINISIDNLDDRFAKSLVKIFSKFFFNYSKNGEVRASMPFNIFLEEAHRYVQNDSDIDILGYNIFERIAKEGRKYGVLLGLISQRPCEISETCLSQCSNYLLFKLTHPLDINYVSTVIPGMTKELIDKVKVSTSGTCLAFGSAFIIPQLVNLDLPDPRPNSDSVDFRKIWFK